VKNRRRITPTWFSTCPFSHPEAGGAGDRIDQIMPAHLLEAAVIGAVAAHEDRVYRGLHVVIDAARTAAAEEGESLIVRVEDHLLALPRIGANEDHPAVTKPDMGDLNRGRDPVDQDDLVAPIELVSLSRIKAQRHIGRSGRFSLGFRPAGRIPPHGIVAAVITKAAKFFKDPDVRQALALRPRRVLGQQIVQLIAPGPDLRLGLNAALVGELGRA
jgi:hypothetical protein